MRIRYPVSRSSPSDRREPIDTESGGPNATTRPIQFVGSVHITGRSPIAFVRSARSQCSAKPWITASYRFVFSVFSRASNRLWGVLSNHIFADSWIGRSRKQQPDSSNALGGGANRGRIDIAARAQKIDTTQNSCARIAGKLRPIWSARVLVNQSPIYGRRSSGTLERRGSILRTTRPDLAILSANRSDSAPASSRTAGFRPGPDGT